MRGSWLPFTAAAIALLASCGSDSNSDAVVRSEDLAAFCATAHDYGRATQTIDDPASTKALWDTQPALIEEANKAVPAKEAQDWATVLTAGDATRTRLEANQWVAPSADPAPDEAFLAASKRLQGVCTEVVLDFQRH